MSASKRRPIETARREDADAIATLTAALAARPPDEERTRWRARLVDGGETDRQLVVVARAEDRVVAFARCSLVDAGGAEAIPTVPGGWCLTGVLVAPTQRGRGWGRALTIARLRWLAARTRAVWCVTDPDNAASLALHDALGFVVTRRDVPPRTPGGAPRLLLERTGEFAADLD